MYESPIDATASEDHDVMRSDYEPDKSTESGELREEPIEGVDDVKTHDGELTPEPISSSTPMSQDHYSSHSNSVCSYPDTSDMKTTCSPTRRNLVNVYADMSRGSTTTLRDEDVHLREILITQMDLLKQQADMNKKQIREELFGLKNR
jgi:hypothetical protein